MPARPPARRKAPPPPKRFDLNPWLRIAFGIVTLVAGIIVIFLRPDAVVYVLGCFAYVYVQTRSQRTDSSGGGEGHVDEVHQDGPQP